MGIGRAIGQDKGTGIVQPRQRIRLVSILPALALAGCATTTLPPQDAGISVPQDWAESSLAPVSIDLAQYWTMLGDPLLSGFVEQAITQNLDLAQSAARLGQARAQLASARAGYFPQVNARSL